MVITPGNSVHKSFFHNPLLKRGLIILLAFCIALPFGLSALAQTKPATNLFGSSLIDGFDRIVSMAQTGDRLYVRTRDAVYAYASGDQRAVKVAKTPDIYGFSAQDASRQPNITYLFASGQNLLGLEVLQQTLYTVTIANEALELSNPVKHDMEEFFSGEEPYRYFSDPQWMSVENGRLYMKVRNYESKPADLFSFDLTTGEKKAHNVAHFLSMTAYKDGRMLVSVLDPMNAFDPETQSMKKPQLMVFDPAGDTVTGLDIIIPYSSDNIDSSPLYYDAQEDALYTFNATDVYRMDGDFKTPRLIGYLPMFGNPWTLNVGGLLPAPDGRLAIGFGQNVYLRERTEAGKEGITVLTIAGGAMDMNTYNRVLMEMDHVTLRPVEGLNFNQMDQEILAGMFLTGTVNVDILPINAYSFDLQKLIDKGYLANLSDNGTIRDFVNSVAQNLSGSLVRDQAIYAVPTGLVLFPMIGYIKPFADLGLEMPRDIRQLIDLSRRWAEELQEQHPDYSLFANAENMRESLRSILIDRYMMNRFGAGEDLVFDTPIFRELMQQVESISYGDLDMNVDWETQEGMAAMEEMWEKTGLIEINMGFEPTSFKDISAAGDDNDAFLPMILPMEEGQDAYQNADISLLAVLSSSPNQEVAKQFVANVINKLSEANKATLDLNKTDAIPNPNYEQQLAELEKGLQQMQDAYNRAEGAARSNLEEDLSSFRAHVERFRESNKVLLSAQDLEQLHGLVAKLHNLSGVQIAQQNAFHSNYEILQQYYDGTISLDQMIRQMDDTLRLVRMEYQ